MYQQQRNSYNNQNNSNYPFFTLNSNNNNNNQYVNNNGQPPSTTPTQQNYKPTFFNRLFGLPSHDAISILKFKLKILKIILICFSMVAALIFYTITGFTSRTTTITTQYQNETYLPETRFLFLSAIPIIEFQVRKINSQTAEDEYLISGVYDSITEEYTLNGTSSNCIVTVPSSGYFDIQSDCISLSDKESIYLYFYTLDTSNFYVGVVLDEDLNNMKIINSTLQSNMGLTKSIVSDSDGVSTTKYKTTMGISSSRIMYTDSSYSLGYRAIQYGIFYASNMVLSESIQTNSQIVIEILSNIGSTITLILLGCEIGIAQLTKLLIRDKSGWIDDEIRECILYHSDQINLDNINLNNDENDESDNEDHDNNINVNKQEQIEEEDGINDNQVEFENSDDENEIVNIKDDENQQDEENDNNNYFLLREMN